MPVRDTMLEHIKRSGATIVSEIDGRIAVSGGEVLRAVIPCEAVRAEAEHTVELSFSSETPVMRYGENEFLSHESSDADFSRLSEVGSVLRNHDANQVVGVPTRTWLDTSTRRGKIIMRFGTTPQALLAEQEVLVDKTLRGVSVGYRVSEWALLKDETVTYNGRIKGPGYVATKWQALEVSLTPIAADPTVGVNRSEQEQQKDNTMPASTPVSATEAAPAVVVAPVAPVVPAPDVRAIERERITTITRSCEQHGISVEVRDQLIASDASVADANARILAELKGRSTPTAQTVEVVADERAKVARAMVDGLSLRCGKMTLAEVRQSKSGGESFAGMSLREIARECLKRRGLRHDGDVRDMVGLAMRGPAMSNSDLDAFIRGETISGSTSDFSYILAATANKSMLNGYGRVRTTWQKWAKKGSLSDFKATDRIALSEAGDLQQILEGGAYKHTAMGDRKNTAQVYTYGLKFTLSRQAIINDDMSMLTDIPNKLGAGAKRLPNQLAVVKLLSNPVMGDSVATFASGHNNHSHVTGYRFDTLANGEAGFKNAVIMLQKQRGFLHAKAAAESKTMFLNLEPSVLLVGPSNQFIAKQVVGAVTQPSQSNSGVPNPVYGMAEVVTESMLEDTLVTGNSVYSWYLFADPEIAPVVEISFLNGVEEPFMEEVEQTDADGRVMKVRLDVGANIIDYAGAVLEVGTT